MKQFDAVVVGAGSMGAFACLQLARRGLRVAGIDAFYPPHSNGSHSGDTRVFRVAYAEHPDYVPLAQRSSLLWDRLGEAFGKPLLHRTGMLSMGAPGDPFLNGIRTSAQAHGLEIEELSGQEIRRRFPAFAPPEGWQGVFETAAGWLDVPAAIDGALHAAAKSGATILPDSKVVQWSVRGSTITVATASETLQTERLVIAAGAGSNELLRELKLPLVVERKTLTWIEPHDPRWFAPGVFPVFGIADDFFYGFPNIAGHGVKLAIHWQRGEVLDDPFGPVRPAGEPDFEPVIRLANRYFPELTEAPPAGLARVRRGATCLYTMTPDEHFILDRHPAHENVWFAAGFSGHGFKFAPAIGEALADLCIEKSSPLPVGFLRIGARFARPAHPEPGS